MRHALSPAWMLDHDTDAYYKISRAFVDGQPSGGPTRDHILDNITLYWLTGTEASAARTYWESGRAAAAAARACVGLPRREVDSDDNVVPHRPPSALSRWPTPTASHRLLAEQPLTRRAGGRASRELPMLVARVHRRVDRYVRAADRLSADDRDVEWHEVSEEAVADLRRRIAVWRPPEREPVDDQSQGVQLATVQNLVNYWATEYDWRRCEAQLNTLDQSLTSIDGLDIHFLHVRSPHENALPLIVSHGWPGSIIEQLKIIEPLTDPLAHGGSAADAFDVVIPSLPGYGFSGKPAVTGWGPDRIARAWAVLMKRLGYTRYVTQGGDWGTAVSAAMARQAPQGLLGVHVNFAQMVPLDVLARLRNGEQPPAAFSEAEKRAYGQVAFATLHRGYGVIQGTRPQTIGYSLADTPVGLAAWLLGHDATTYAHLAQLFAGQPYGALTRDDVLDNTSLYWLTNTATSAARLYWQQAVTGVNFYATADVSLPTAVTVFPEEYVQAPRSWTEQAYHNLIYFNEADTGGHFAAWEQPQLFSHELRAAFRTLR